MAINTDVEDWGGVGSNDSGERAWLLQSPSVDSDRHLDTEGRRSGGVSSLGACFIVVNAALGAGLLNFPAAFSMAGGVTAGVMLQMVSNESTYQEVVRATCGKVTGVICEVAIAVYTFGTCIAFFIVIGDQLDRLIAAVAHDTDSTVHGYWYTDRKFTIVVTAVLIILPLSIPKEIGFQKYASALSVMGTWYVTIVIIIKYFEPDKEISPGYIPARQKLLHLHRHALLDLLNRCFCYSSTSWTAVFNAMPTICFGFQEQVLSPCALITHCVPNNQSFSLVDTFRKLFLKTCQITDSHSVCGFLTFGSNVSQDVLMSYPSNDIAVAIARAFIVICVITSYPILHFCGRAVIEGLWLRFQGEQVEVCVRREQRRRILQTLVWFVVTLVLALFIPDIGRVISLIGGLAACFIFVFPGL
ncbi:putative sodium-coupled neutral amino acid transporter 7 [Collichthys lucidus]|uniref:Sodium-coupled neutral amino acid transporter 7 n=1 Tax=Collichthys lucidus TaxID=240159 RepID=A0A4U5U8K2_COLLU|nr:putative sodium-coupled neutral amino acid transporter 7 [Collichthys lucidus]